MDLKWLEDFLCLARTGNFSRAAEERNVTQSAFSRRIKALEMGLGVALIDRSTYPTSLTPAGKMVRESAEEVVRSMTQLREELRLRARGDSKTVTFAAQHTVSLWFFPAWLKQLETQTRPLATRLLADNLHNCVQSLAEGNCDFLLCFHYPGASPLLDEGQYPILKLGEDRLIPVTAPDPERGALYRLPGNRHAPIPLLAYSAEVFLGNTVTRMLKERKKTSHLIKTHENAMAEALKALAVEGLGLAWLPHISIKRELRSGRLVRAGDESWDVPLEIRIYRGPEGVRPEVDAIWSQLTAQNASLN